MICLLILLCLQIYIIAAAHSTDYVERSKKDFLATWADQRTNVERISLLEQKVSPILGISILLFAGHHDQFHSFPVLLLRPVGRP